MNERRIPLSAGNVRNFHLYLRKHLDFFPADAVGGSNRRELGRPLTVKFEPGPTVETDIDGDKLFFCSRIAIREFFEGSAATDGDVVVVERTGERDYLVRLEAKA